MAVDASSSFKNPATLIHCITDLRRFRLFANPLLELIWRVDVNTEKHLRVLGAAILSTLAEKNAGFIGIDPHVVDAVWNQVRLSRQTWDPKTVVRIRGKQRNKSGRRMRRGAAWYMQLVCRDYTQCGIPELPPELMTYRDDFDHPRRLGGTLGGMDYTGGSKEQD